MFNKSDSISDFDPELWASMQEEEQRQEHHVELIASENYTSNRVLQAQGSVLTNNMPRDTPVNGITEVVNSSTKLRF